MTKLSKYKIIRTASAAPEVKVANPRFNAEEIAKTALDASKRGATLIAFPELALTSYSCGDLFFQSALREAALAGLKSLLEKTKDSDILIFAGAPVETGGRLYNCAVALAKGEVLGVVPKTFLCNTNQYYEERQFSSEFDRTVSEISMFGKSVPFGADVVFDIENIPGCRIGVEICEDLWAIKPPSFDLAAAGATIIVNLSASDEYLGKLEYRTDLVRTQSARCLAGYVYSSCGPGESTTDVVYSGHCMICENGVIFDETERFSFETRVAYADIDVEALVNERLNNNSYGFSRLDKGYRVVRVRLDDAESEDLLRPVEKYPFAPADQSKLERMCRETFSLQTTGLAKRLRHVGTDKAVVGVSGGLDSTLALLVCAKTFDKLGFDRKNIFAVTMPGFGTSDRTKSNAQKIAESVGATFKTMPIGKFVREGFKLIDHDENNRNVVYENAQARARTDLLMNYANKVGGIHVGTGDLSELALGWQTYGGDHMSMYSVNAGVPKTLIKRLVEWTARAEFSGEASTALLDVIATPISPELLPPGEDGSIKQLTEETLGKYDLSDFFLYNFFRKKYPPEKLIFLAGVAFKEEYDKNELKLRLKDFLRRFFASQFKRSCMPDGVKIGAASLSPRGEWRSPSDAEAEIWLETRCE